MAEKRKLSDEEVQGRLHEVPGWELVQGKLHREVKFPDFVQAFGYMSQIALLAEKLNHHPEWSNVYSRVTIDLQTHEVGGISDLDFELAMAANRYLGEG